MRSYVRSVVDIDSTDITDDTLNRFLGEGYDVIVYSEKRWPFFEVSTTFNTVASQKDYTLAVVGAAVTGGLRELAALRTDDHVATYVGRDEGDVVYPLNVTGQGSPWWWSYWGKQSACIPHQPALRQSTPAGTRTRLLSGLVQSMGQNHPICPIRSTLWWQRTESPVLTSSRKIRRWQRSISRFSTRNSTTSKPATTTCRHLNRCC